MEKGVKQWDPLSPYLFDAVLEESLKIKLVEEGARIKGQWLNNLRFPDEIILSSSNLREVRDITEELINENGKVGLSMNTSKTKLITNKQTEGFLVRREEIEIVKEYNYLGQIVAFEDRGRLELRVRTAKA